MDDMQMILTYRDGLSSELRSAAHAAAEKGGGVDPLWRGLAHTLYTAATWVDDQRDFPGLRGLMDVAEVLNSEAS